MENSEERTVFLEIQTTMYAKEKEVNKETTIGEEGGSNNHFATTTGM